MNLIDLFLDLVRTGIRRLWKGRMVLHHWRLERYREHIEDSPLRFEDNVDITKRVIGGFKGYRKWISAIESAGMIRDFFFRIFYIINVEWVLYLLKRRRLYLVFVGNKPAKF